MFPISKLNMLPAHALAAVGVLAAAVLLPRHVYAEGDWEITAESQEALDLGLEWLAKNQGPEGNWDSNDLGLVSMGALAFMAAGHMPGRGPYGENVEKALEYILKNVKRTGLLNISDERRDMYNHGLSTFVLGQAYGMSEDRRIGEVLEDALRLIANTQSEDGGWDYVARRQDRGHDLSLAVMQALALRSAVDSGLEVPPEVVRKAIHSVREHYTPQGASPRDPEEKQRQHPGQFTYTKGGGNATTAMAAAGVVCLQEFGQYDDWRIDKSMGAVRKAISDKMVPRGRGRGRVGLDAYTLYYVSQALYQVGGKDWRQYYPRLRDTVVSGQIIAPNDPKKHGAWPSDHRVGGKPGELYMTAACCFALALPNRYLPILQEGRIEGLQNRFGAPGAEAPQP